MINDTENSKMSSWFFVVKRHEVFSGKVLWRMKGETLKDCKVSNSVLNIVLGFWKQETWVRVEGIRKGLMKDAAIGLGPWKTGPNVVLCSYSIFLICKELFKINKSSIPIAKKGKGIKILHKQQKYQEAC